jgi:hypothetical protein
MYIVKFACLDGSYEEYFYHHLTDASFHFSLFDNDDSELYIDISLLEVNGCNAKQLKIKKFKEGATL